MGKFKKGWQTFIEAFAYFFNFKVRRIEESKRLRSRWQKAKMEELEDELNQLRKKKVVLESVLNILKFCVVGIPLSILLGFPKSFSKTMNLKLDNQEKQIALTVSIVVLIFLTLIFGLVYIGIKLKLSNLDNHESEINEIYKEHK